MKSQSIVSALALTIVGLILIYFLYTTYYTAIGTAVEKTDPYLKFSKLIEEYLKVTSAEYNVFASGDSNYIFLHLMVSNEGIEPIYYKLPLTAYVYTLDGNEEHIQHVTLYVTNSTSAFYPSIPYELNGIEAKTVPGTPVRGYLVVNGVQIPFTLSPVGFTVSGIMLCRSCSECQYIIDHNRSSSILLVAGDITIDRNPCIHLYGDGNGLQILCNDHKLTGDGSQTAFLFDNDSNYTVAECEVENVSKAVEVNHSSSTISSFTVSNATHAIYLHYPIDPSSYNVNISDFMYNSKKLFFYKPGYGSIFTPYQPLAVWVSGFSSGVSVDGGNGVLEAVYPLVAILNSSNVTISNFKFDTSDPYGVIILNSSNVTISGSEMNFHGSVYGIYSSNSSYSIQNVNINSTASKDLYIHSSDLNLGDLILR